MIPDTDTKTDLYNMVTIKNPLNEDFIFGYDNKGRVVVTRDAEGHSVRVPNPQYDERGNYMIRAGETRNFPKFIARTAIKHLVDRILMKQDNTGKLLNLQSERDRVTALIFVKEEKFDRPVIPTDNQLVEQMNVESDLDRVLQRNQERLKAQEPEVVTPEQEPEEQFDGLEEPVDNTSPEQPPQEEIVDQPTVTGKAESTEPTSDLPSREKMIEYAVNSLGVDPQVVIKTKGPNQGKTIADVWETMTDEELYNELQIGEGDINA